MQPTLDASPSLKAGGAALAVAALLGLAIYAGPEQLHAPAGVAYAAAGAFALAGLVLLARAIGVDRAGPWLICLLLAVLTSMPAWVAMGGGPRRCAAMLTPIRSLVSESVCRGAFGIAALLMGLMLVWAVRDAIRGD